jgi:hypothetical protein
MCRWQQHLHWRVHCWWVLGKKTKLFTNGLVFSSNASVGALSFSSLPRRRCITRTPITTARNQAQRDIHHTSIVTVYCPALCQSYAMPTSRFNTCHSPRTFGPRTCSLGFASQTRPSSHTGMCVACIGTVSCSAVLDRERERERQTERERARVALHIDVQRIRSTQR